MTKEIYRLARLHIGPDLLIYNEKRPVGFELTIHIYPFHAMDINDIHTKLTRFEYTLLLSFRKKDPGVPLTAEEIVTLGIARQNAGNYMCGLREKIATASGRERPIIHTRKKPQGWILLANIEFAKDYPTSSFEEP